MISFLNIKKSIHNKKRTTQKGFTLLELLLVVAIIAILASVIFIVLDPPTRFKNARDSARHVDVTAISNAVKIHQLDNNGDYLQSIASMTVDTVYMISGVTTTSGCLKTCDTAIAGGSNCVNIEGLIVAGNLGQVPVSPDGAETWTSVLTGYYMERKANGSVKVGACESENTTEISVVQ